MKKIKMRTVLEDKLDILVGLCFELVNFHEVLIPLDFNLLSGGQCGVLGQGHPSHRRRLGTSTS